MVGNGRKVAGFSSTKICDLWIFCKLRAEYSFDYNSKSGWNTKLGSENPLRRTDAKSLFGLFSRPQSPLSTRKPEQLQLDT